MISGDLFEDGMPIHDLELIFMKTFLRDNIEIVSPLQLPIAHHLLMKLENLTTDLERQQMINELGEMWDDGEHTEQQES